MGSETDIEQSSTLTLPLFSITTMESPERPGMLTSPLHTSASVPFRWEEEPGKPKPCTALTTYSNPNNGFAHKCLELPPRLLLMDHANSSKLSSSPTTVLEGPYVGRPRFQGSSFRMSSECYGSFRRSLSPERDHDPLGAFVLKRGHKERGGFGSWSWRRGVLKGNKREVGGGSYVFPSSVDRDSDCSRESDESSSSTSTSTSDKITTIKRAGSFPTLSVPVVKSHFWATIYGGLKQVVPWKIKKAKKDGLLSVD
ncbi:hypothetical protein ACOSP7_000811 [Xanthoceras sorbifolium]|uniref:Uncharacterized protein n=1 Tax=Xanthoceras sorbifolium TaxID=99658 RepID=A0ABQ8IP24_9ROSI|nr:hypothetical protein JRO89_XS01G0336400 [Xanthoceras sorbifolium]